MYQEETSSIDFTDKHEVAREMHRLAIDIGYGVEKIMATRKLPPVTITKEDLGKSWCHTKLNPTEKVTLHPIPYEGDDRQAWLNWKIRKDESSKIPPTPPVSAEAIDKETLRTLTQLPRYYKDIRDGEKIWLFRNEDGVPVGWLAINDTNSKEACHINQIAVAGRYEDQGYGSALLKWLKSHYKSIGLSLTAYDPDSKRGMEQAIPRLRRFYVRNGFAAGNGVNFSWNKNDPNLEEAVPGEELTVTKSIVADGTIYWDSNLRQAYLEKLASDGSLEKALGKEGAVAAKSWLDIRKQAYEVEQQAQEFSS